MVGLNIESGILQAIAFAPDKKRVESIAVQELDFEKDPAARLADGLKELTLIPPLQKERTVCLSVGGEGVVIRYLTIPVSPRDNMNDLIKQTLEQRIPFRGDQVYFDYQVLGPGEKRNQVKIVLVAAQKALITEKINLASAAGLKVGAVEADSVALINTWLSQRQWSKTKEREASAFLNIGFDTTVLNIISQQEPLLSRDIKFGVTTLMETLGKNNRLKPSENLRLLKEGGQSKEPSFLNWLRGNIDNLSEEIKLSFEYAKNQLGTNPNKIYLAGHLKALPNISRLLSDNLETEIITYNPFPESELKPELSSLVANNEPAFVLAMGLAFHSDD
ncbi:MAG: pilus assembly protein PilM [Candidatus Omnitrophota bacterium]